MSDMEERVSDFSDDEEDEEVDPRVQGELESLNSASSEINVLENELEKSRNKFRSLLTDSSQRLNILFKKLGKVVLKARPYYELHRESRKAQAEAQKAAVNFQRANSIYRAAKETVSLAEEKIVSFSGEKREFDSAWQEMLNHATMKFMESETDKTKSEQEHLMKAAEYAAISSKLRFYEKDMPRSISKARPYFDLKEKLEHSLQLERQNVDDLHRALLCSKFKYKEALNNLEAISEEIHLKRRKRLSLPPRTPGVGAESIGDQSDLPSINLDNLSDTCSFASSLDELEADGASLRDLDQSEFEKQFTVGPGLGELIKTMAGASITDDTADKERVPPVGVHENKATVRDKVVTSQEIGVQVQMEPPIHRNVSAPQLTDTWTGQSQPVTAAVPSAFNPATSNNYRINTASDATRTGIYIPQHIPSQKAVGGPGPAQGLSVLPAGNDRKSRKDQQKIQTKMAFPMLQGLSEIHRKMSPTTGRANATATSHASTTPVLSDKAPSGVRQETPGGAERPSTQDDHGSDTSNSQGVDTGHQSAKKHKEFFV